MRGTPEQRAEKWARRTASSQTDWQAGVEAVTDSPMAKAAAQADLWQQRLTQPETKDKFKRNVGRVSTEQWKAKTVAGAGRFSAGAQANVDKMVAHQRDSEAYIAAGQRMIATMPNLTVEDKANRAAAWVRYMAKYKKPS
jgi:hypothetical protein